MMTFAKIFYFWSLRHVSIFFAIMNFTITSFFPKSLNILQWLSMDHSLLTLVETTVRIRSVRSLMEVEVYDSVYVFPNMLLILLEMQQATFNFEIQSENKRKFNMQQLLLSYVPGVWDEFLRFIRILPERRWWKVWEDGHHVVSQVTKVK